MRISDWSSDVCSSDLNFDAKVWGAELEAVFAPTRNLRFNANVGYLKTRIADGESSIDIMNRTQGNPDYVLVKPWLQLPSNCVVPVGVAERWEEHTSELQSLMRISYAVFCLQKKICCLGSLSKANSCTQARKGYD